MAKGLIICTALLLAAACSARDPHQQLARSVTEVRSWAADVCLVADRWRQRSLPTHYALDATEDAVRNLAGLEQQIDGQRSVDEGARRDAMRAARAVRDLCGRLKTDFEHGNGAAAIARCREMSRWRDHLAEMATAEARR